MWGALGGSTMIYIKVPKEIKEYRAKAVLGLTYRQVKFLVIGAVLGLGTSFFLNPIIGTDGIAIVITMFIVPFIVIGFTDHDGIPMEVFFKYIIIFYKQKQKLSYESSDAFSDSTIKGGTDNDQSIKEKIRNYREQRRIKQEQKLLLEDGTKKATKREKKSSKRNPLSKNV